MSIVMFVLGFAVGVIACASALSYFIRGFLRGFDESLKKWTEANIGAIQGETPPDAG